MEPCWYKRSVRLPSLILLLGGLAAAQDAPAETPAAQTPAEAPADAAPAAPPAPPPSPQTMGTLRLESGAVGADVVVDGATIGQVPLPGPWTLPPGPHTVEVRPTGGSPAKAGIVVTAGQTVEVKLLVQQVVAAVEVERQVIERSVGPGFSLVTAGYVTAGVGVLAVISGVVFGLDASSTAEAARDYDLADPDNDRGGQQALIDESQDAAFYSNLSFGVAGVAILAAASMVVLSSDSPFKPRRRRVQARPVAGGGVLQWTF